MFRKRRSLSVKLFLLSSFVWVIWANVDMLGSAVEALTNISRELKMKMQMQQIALCCKLEFIDRNELPRNPVKVYRQALASDNRVVSPDTGKDPWGRWYRIYPTQKGFYIMSSGPDGRFGTPDDCRFHQVLIDVGYKPIDPKTFFAREATSTKKSSRKRR